MPPQQFGIPDSFAPAGRVYRLHPRPEGEWTVEEQATGENVATLVATSPDLGDPEWYVVSDGTTEPDGYWPSWRAALTSFLETLA